MSPRTVIPPTGSSAVNGDGFAFVLLSASDDHGNSGRDSLGAGGAELGYGGFKHSLVVEFDMHMDKDERDPSSNHISVHVAGDIAAVIHINTHTGAATPAAATGDRNQPVNAFEGVDAWISGPHIAELRSYVPAVHRRTPPSTTVQPLQTARG